MWVYIDSLKQLHDAARPQVWRQRADLIYLHIQKQPIAGDKMRGLQRGKAINRARNTSISTPAARVDTHVRVGLSSREQRAKQSTQVVSAKSPCGSKRTRWVLIGEQRQEGVHMLNTGSAHPKGSAVSTVRLSSFSPSENITVQPNAQLKWKGNQWQPLRVYWVLWVVNMSQIVRKKGKFAQKKPPHSDLTPIHSFDAAEEISISLLCTFFVRFCSPLIM